MWQEDPFSNQDPFASHNGFDSDHGQIENKDVFGAGDDPFKGGMFSQNHPLDLENASYRFHPILTSCEQLKTWRIGCCHPSPFSIIFALHCRIEGESISQDQSECAFS
jgi:hypothetical protein